MPSSPRFFKSPFKSEFCEFFKCRTMRGVADWIIGQPDQSALVQPGFLRVCHEDAISIVSQLPEELLEHVPQIKELRETVEVLRETVGVLEEKVEGLEKKLGEFEVEDAKQDDALQKFVAETANAAKKTK